MPPLPAPTATVTSLTALNTSSAPNYCSLVQPKYGGTPRVKIASRSGCPDWNQQEIGNVSRRSIRELLYPGATTKIFAHLMPWWPHTATNSGYVSNDINQVRKQMTDMQERGIQGVIINYYYLSHDACCKKWRDECNARGNFEFSMNFDVGIIRNVATGSRTAKIIEACNYVNTTFVPSSRYTRWNGRPLYTFFGFSEFDSELNWVNIKPQLKGNPLLVFRNVGAYTGQNSDGISDGAYSWRGATSVYSKAKSYPTKLTIGSAGCRFWDDMASWGAGDHVGAADGDYWMARFAEINQYFSTSFQLPMLQLVTWNDIEEGTALEFGVNNNATVNLSLASKVANWTMTGGSGARNVAEYRVWGSVDGINLSLVKTLPVSTPNLDLETLQLPAGVYKFRVQAIGKACIFNQLSAEITYTEVSEGPIGPPNPPPPQPFDQSTLADEQGVNSSAFFDYRPGSTDSGVAANFSAGASVDKSLNPPARHVSDEFPQPLLPDAGLGFESTRIICSTEDWWGTTGHVDNGYTSNTQLQMDKMVVDMKRRGYHVACPTWYGQGHTAGQVAINEAALKLKIACQKAGFKMCLMPGLMIWDGADANARMASFKADMLYAYNNFFQDPVYEKHTDGRPLVFLFSEENVNAMPNTNTTQWTSILAYLAASAGNPRLISRHSSAIDKMYTGGAFPWVSPCGSSDAKQGAGLAYLNFFYNRVQTDAPADWPIVGGAYAGFYDGMAGWKINCSDGTERFINRRAGQTWLDTWKAMGPWFGAGKRVMHYILVSTWGDYEEGTEIELGIDAGLNVTAAINNGQLTWQAQGNLNALAKTTVWVSSDDGVHLNRLLDRNAALGVLNLANLALLAGTYQFWVQAQGVNSVQSPMSNKVVLTIATPQEPPPIDEPPVIVPEDAPTPWVPATLTPVPTPDPARVLCQRYRERFIAVSSE